MKLHEVWKLREKCISRLCFNLLSMIGPFFFFNYMSKHDQILSKCSSEANYKLNVCWVETKDSSTGFYQLFGVMLHWCQHWACMCPRYLVYHKLLNYAGPYELVLVQYDLTCIGTEKKAIFIFPLFWQGAACVNTSTAENFLCWPGHLLAAALALESLA